MISFDDIKPGKLLVVINAFLGRRRIVYQIISPLRKYKLGYNNKTHINVTIERIGYHPDPKYKKFRKLDLCFGKEELLRNNNCLPSWLKKPRINEIFNWYILKFENEMYNQEQNP